MAQTVTPRKALYARLLADPNVTALVGDRIYHQTPDQDAIYPLLVLNTISNVDVRDLAGVAYTQTRIQVTAIAETLPEAESVAAAVRRSLNGFSGLMAGALPVMLCRVDNYEPMYEDELRQTHYYIDVILWHKGGT